MQVKVGRGPLHITLSERNMEQLREHGSITKLIPGISYITVEVEPNDVHYERKQTELE